MARFAIKHVYAGHMRDGKALWGVVHTRDLSYGYLMMLKWLETSGPEVALKYPPARMGIMSLWVRSGTGSAKDCIRLVRSQIRSRRRCAEYGDLFGEYSMVVVGANARNRSERSRELGRNPEHLSCGRAFLDEELPMLPKAKVDDFRCYVGVAASGSG